MFTKRILSILLFLLFTVACTQQQPTSVPPTEMPPTDVPPTAVPPTEIPPTPLPPVQMPPADITLAQANAAIVAAHDKAVEQGTLMNIAVVDRSGDLKAFVRMDDAFIGSIDIAIRKARTSAIFPFDTATLGQLSQPGQPLYNIELSNGGLISFGGGLPIMDGDGNQIGAIGVSGASVEEDVDVATAGKEAVLAAELATLSGDSSTQLGQALMALDAAEAKAVEIDVPMDIAIVDESANLKAFRRMDDAFLGSIDIAIKKAKTSALFYPLTTGQIGELSQPGQPLYQIEVSNDGLISFGGGVPLTDSAGTPSGGIGVSTGSVEQDHEVAMAGAAVYEGETLANPAVNITYDQALNVLAAAHIKAMEQGTLMNIAIVDSGGNLKMFLRMDGAFLGSIDIALTKAKTAAYFAPLDTATLGTLSQPGQPLYNIELSNDGLITFGGGISIVDSAGNTIGAIGVSGASVEEDVEVATAGADAMLSDDRFALGADGNSELGQALLALFAAQERATEIGVPMDIAVVDDGADLKAFVRMDGAFLGSIDIAIKKATTSALFYPLDTGTLGELSQPGQSLFRIELSNDGLITFPGGVALTPNDETPFGGIGVSTGSVEEDFDVATAGASILVP